MKIMTCEMCGGHDLIKDNGVFVCQNCGCKYTVDEARKILSDGPVAVKVDETDNLNNLYVIARRARDENNSENAAKYYEMILVRDPNSWEASFYTVFFQASSCKVAEIKNAAYSVRNCIRPTFSLILKSLQGEEGINAASEVAGRCADLASRLYLSAYDSFLNGGSERIKEYCERTVASASIFYEIGDSYLNAFGDQPRIKKLAISAWSNGIAIHDRLYQYKSSLLASCCAFDIRAKYERFIDQTKDPIQREEEKLQTLNIELADSIADSSKGARLFILLLLIGGILLLMYSISGRELRVGLLVLGIILISVAVVLFGDSMSSEKRASEVPEEIKKVEKKISELKKENESN